MMQNNEIKLAISNIAWACLSDSINLSFNFIFASIGLLEVFIILITSSIFLIAISKPSNIWLRSFATFRSY